MVLEATDADDLCPALPSIEEVLRSPGTSFWLRNALNAASFRDPVDAVNDAELLFRLLQRRLNTVFH